MEEGGGVKTVIEDGEMKKIGVIWTDLVDG